MGGRPHQGAPASPLPPGDATGRGPLVGREGNREGSMIDVDLERLVNWCTLPEYPGRLFYSDHGDCIHLGEMRVPEDAELVVSFAQRICVLSASQFQAGQGSAYEQSRLNAQEYGTRYYGALKQRNEAAQAFRRYAKHDDPCYRKSETECSCGLLQLQAKMRGRCY